MAGKGGKGLLAGKTTKDKDKDKDKKRPVSRSSRAGIQFPVGRIHRQLKQRIQANGPTPRVIITDPELIKDVFNKNYDFPKPSVNPLVSLLANGIVNYEGEKWRKHRRIINPAFNLEKLKATTWRALSLD